MRLSTLLSSRRPVSAEASPGLAPRGAEALAKAAGRDPYAAAELICAMAVGFPSTTPASGYGPRPAPGRRTVGDRAPPIPGSTPATRCLRAHFPGAIPLW